MAIQTVLSRQAKPEPHDAASSGKAVAAAFRARNPIYSSRSRKDSERIIARSDIGAPAMVVIATRDEPLSSRASGSVPI